MDQRGTEGSRSVSDGEHDAPAEVEAPLAEGERCTAETTAGDVLYRCALQDGHEGDHAFSQVESSDVDEPEDEQEDEPEDGEDEAERVQKMARSLDTLVKHVAKRMGEIMGDQAGDFEECEICNYWNTPGWRMKGPLPAEVEQVVRVALGGANSAEWKPDEYSRACETCNGLGQVLTGSRVQGQEALQCIACKGLGWKPIGNERATGAFAVANGPQAAAPLSLAPDTPAAPESPEITAAKAELQNAGYFVVAPVAAVS